MKSKVILYQNLCHVEKMTSFLTVVITGFSKQNEITGIYQMICRDLRSIKDAHAGSLQRGVDEVSPKLLNNV